MTGDGERIARLEERAAATDKRIEAMEKLLSKMDDIVRALQLKLVGAVALVTALIELGFRVWGKT